MRTNKWGTLGSRYTLLTNSNKVENHGVPDHNGTIIRQDAFGTCYVKKFTKRPKIENGGLQ